MLQARDDEVVQHDRLDLQRHGRVKKPPAEDFANLFRRSGPALTGLRRPEHSAFGEHQQNATDWTLLAAIPTDTKSQRMSVLQGDAWFGASLT